MVVRHEVCSSVVRRIGENKVPVFNDDMKLCALLKAIINEGFQVLQAQGINIIDPELTYE